MIATYWEMTVQNILQGRVKPPISASLCASLDLKNPGDFTVAEGHGYPLVYGKVLAAMCYPVWHIMQVYLATSHKRNPVQRHSSISKWLF
jgi:hypothetical protein